RGNGSLPKLWYSIHIRPCGTGIPAGRFAVLPGVARNPEQRRWKAIQRWPDIENKPNFSRRFSSLKFFNCRKMLKTLPLLFNRSY
ncbi:MAG: hypothetical protein D6732_19865, partial [Methanobacteriota archaeon]